MFFTRKKVLLNLPHEIQNIFIDKQMLSAPQLDCTFILSFIFLGRILLFVVISVIMFPIMLNFIENKLINNEQLKYIVIIA